jgi:hypothetical protein
MATCDDVPAAEVQALVEYALPWLYARGFAMIPLSRDPATMAHVPFSLLPRKLPKSALAHAYALAGPFGALVDRVARDATWLRDTLKR